MQTDNNQGNDIGDTSGVETNNPGKTGEKAPDSPVVDENGEPLNGDGLTKAEVYEQQAT